MKFIFYYQISKETQAEIDGKVDHYVKVGGTLRLTCRVYLGNAGPDDTYAKTAVIHWFHDQRLLDPDLENWKSYRNALPKKVNSRRVITQTSTNGDQPFKVCIKCNTSLILLTIIYGCV